MKIRDDYESVVYRKFIRWVNGDDQIDQKEITSRDKIRNHDEQNIHKTNIIEEITLDMKSTEK